ncbi:cilia- and flagella-associated protein 410-like isoform X2 [Zophobas morio]|uniref:cilia- and flagella-associated protein 410-like isoform X2 n=1 Tax=Zophobas morio TaxID=2755281 RepID=UPI003083BE39
MAKRLTEEMVIARTKISDLGKIKRLNCWGSELVDVSLLRKMPSVEVLSLSINKINSLVDFQFCKRLEELYIRQNDIRDLNEVVFLQNLPNLKNLWLGENPCANVDGYRLAVIKALPQLQKLDNVQVTQEDLREAQRKGRTLTHPDDAQESEEEYVQPPQQPQQYNKYQDYSESEYSPVQRSPPRQEPSPPRRTEPARKSFSPEPVYVERRRNSYERESPKQQQPPQYYDQRCPGDHAFEDNIHHCDSNYRDVKIVNSQSANCIKEYTNGDRYLHGQPQYREPDVSSTHSHERRERYVCPAAHRAPFTRRPVTRNSNILSAVLRLVKELDYPSLEVVEMEVRSRMDELDE